MSLPATGTDARSKLLDAAFGLIRRRGYSGTSVDDLCRAAGVSKGAFFHHFRGKEDLAAAAADHWSDVTGGFFAAQAYRRLDDPLDRVLGYIDFRKAIIQGEIPEFTCLVGTMVQETFDVSPAIRDACGRSIFDHAAIIEADIAEAMRKYGADGTWTAESLARHTQAVLQGAFILAKAGGGARAVTDSLDHLKRYVRLLFTAKKERGND